MFERKKYIEVILVLFINCTTNYGKKTCLSTELLSSWAARYNKHTATSLHVDLALATNKPT